MVITVPITVAGAIIILIGWNVLKGESMCTDTKMTRHVTPNWQHSHEGVKTENLSNFKNMDENKWPKI